MNKKDINIQIADYTLNCRAVAIIQNNNQILFQKRLQDKYWALPGGKISVGEKSSSTIERELTEELGLTNYTVEEASIIAEHFFTFNNNKVHQYIFGHKVIVDTNDYIFKHEEFKGNEPDKDLIFKWINIDKLNETPIKPDFLINQLENLNKKEIQFTSYQEN